MQDPTTAGGTCACPGTGTDEPGMSTLTRRSVLKVLGAAAAAVALGPAVDLASPAGAAAATGGTLVVVTLRGGADGLSMFPPLGDPGYAAARPGIAVPATRAVRLDTTFGLHPKLSPLLPWWQSGKLGVVNAVGGPWHLRSHFDSVVSMEQAVFGAGPRTGWLDRLLDVLGASRLVGGVTMGSTTPAAMAGPRPTLTIAANDQFDLLVTDAVEPAYRAALQAMHQHTDPSSKACGPTLGALGAVASARGRAPSPANGAAYPPTEFGRELRNVAQLIRGGAPVRVAHVEAGGWDLHAGLGANGGVDGGAMGVLLDDLARSLAAFLTDLGPTLTQRVTVVTATEFGRRVAQNGSGGVDHGRGNAMMLLGAGVVGGRVHGRWPGLSGTALNAGDLAVTTDYRNVLAELLVKRMGLGSYGLGVVFPGLTYRPVGALRA